MKQDIIALTGIVLDEDLEFSLGELCRHCGMSAEEVIAMVEEGLVEPKGVNYRVWRFDGKAFRRIQIARRLQQDLRVNLAGAALALDLLEELEELRRLYYRLNYPS